MSDSQNINNQNETNKIKAKIMHDEIIVKYSYIKDMDSEENIIKKIIELNFDENKIKEYYDVKALIDEIEEEEEKYGICGQPMDGEYIIDKIKEFHGDKKLLVEWIENIIVNGE